MNLRRKVLLGGGLVVAGLLMAFFIFFPGEVENRMNQTRNLPPYKVSEAAQALHERLLVADLHADTLLWNRDLLEHGERGHVDVPRLVKGNVAVQMFTVVTKVPRGVGIGGNRGDSDNITWAAVSQLWPPRTWWSLKHRALYQAKRLRAAASRSDGQLERILTARELEDHLARREKEPHAVGALLGLEGAHALVGDLDNLDAFYEAGFRMIAPVHFFDNDIGGSAHGLEKGGLTELGREMIRRMEELGILLDLAHASPKTFAEAMALSTRPVVVSHTGVKGTCDNQRNLSDVQVQGVAASDGVIGIGYWGTAVCGPGAAAIAKAMRYVADLVGVEHVGLGSDFDGAAKQPFDTTGLPLITEALLAEGFSTNEIRLIMGGNILRVLKETLP